MSIVATRGARHHRSTTTFSYNEKVSNVKTSSDRAGVTRSLHRAVALMRLLASHTRIGWRLSDLAEHAGLDAATVHRLLASLCDEGLATRVPGSRHYTLGPLAFEIGLAATPYFDLGQLAHERLAALALELQGTVFLKLRSGFESVCLARHDGVGTVQSLMLDAGGRRPLCLTAGGVAMLIHLPASERKLIEVQNRRSIGHPDASRWRGVRRMVLRSRPLGFALNLGDIAAGISALGVPLISAGGAPVASLTLALAGSNRIEAQTDGLVERLRREAAQIEPLLAQLRL